MSVLDQLKGELLKQGAQGDAIAAVQKALTAAGVDPGTVDGVFGPKTLEAVKAFQAKVNLDADGIVGPKTIDALKSAAGEHLKAVAAEKLGDMAGAKDAVSQIAGAVGGLFGKK